MIESDNERSVSEESNKQVDAINIIPKIVDDQEPL